MKTSSRPREIGGSFASRRGHAPQLSISDTNHHVTEAIGDMYGEDDEYSKRDSRPLSFVASPLHEAHKVDSYFEPNKASRPRPSPHPNGNPARKANTSPAIMQSPRSKSFEGVGQLSPSLSLREHASDTANTQFPLTDIDYESDPAAVAQELSNLQALRRMSMDIGSTSDPDLPSFQGVSMMPSIAPTGDDDEDDPSRLFWVPARVHPELAPMEFKSFLENRVQSIKRRSGELQASLSPDGSDFGNGGGSLRRKKSMLSRQIDNDGGRGALGYKDGAEQIERKKSLSQTAPDLKISDLKELDALVRDPSKAMRTLSLDTNKRQGGDDQGEENEDMPILPQAPGIGLRRSTRTTYRRGSLRKGERVPFSKRAGSLRGDTDGEDSPVSSPMDSHPATTVAFPLSRVQTEPISTENFSRPNRGMRRPPNVAPTGTPTPIPEDTSIGLSRKQSQTSNGSGSNLLPNSGSLPKNTTFPRPETPVPQIIETPPQENVEVHPSTKKLHQFPERSSSQVASVIQPQHIVPEPPVRSNRRPPLERQSSSAQSIPKNLNSSQSLNDMAQHPSPLPGSNVRTDTLTFIPTLEERKPEKKSKKEKDDPENSSTRKTSWGWFKGSDEKDKKEKRKDDDHKESKRSRGKAPMEKSHDNARLDLLQSTLEPSAIVRGRESLLLDRDSPENRLQEERRKESSRKSGVEKKEKDGLFSFFSSSKKKTDRDPGGKKGSSLRTLSPDPPHHPMKPDVDYNWTRFPIMEERAIYRMAHIKLANPRRALYSQVLLSNFMYSYLAKVQMQHPQLPVPQSAMQKKQEAERRQKEQEQQALQRLEKTDHYRYDYHQGITQYAEPEQQQQPTKSEGVTYVDDSQIYDYDHQDSETLGHSSQRPQSRASQLTAENLYSEQGQYQRRTGNEYYPYGQHDQHKHGHEGGDDEMW